MEFKRLLIETPIDKLIKIVAKRKKITMREAASLLNASESQIEEWVRILEDHGFVELKYPAIGEPEIVFKEIPKEVVEEKKKELEERKEAVKTEAKKFEEKVSKVEKEIEKSDKEFMKLESELKKRLEKLESSLKALEGLKTKKEAVLKEAEEVKEVAEDISKEFERIELDVKNMEKTIEKQLEKLHTHGKEIKNLERMKEKIENEITALEKEMKILKYLVKRPIIKIDIRKILSLHRKTEKIKARRNGIHEKLMKLKKEIEKRKEALNSKGS